MSNFCCFFKATVKSVRGCSFEGCGFSKATSWPSLFWKNKRKRLKNKKLIWQLWITVTTITYSIFLLSLMFLFDVVNVHTREIWLIMQICRGFCPASNIFCPWELSSNISQENRTKILGMHGTKPALKVLMHKKNWSGLRLQNSHSDLCDDLHTSIIRQILFQR